jgi:archaellum biogenesis protein FlaJ (TadC family)
VALVVAILLGFVVRPAGETTIFVVVVILVVFSLVRFGGAWWLRYQDHWWREANLPSDGRTERSRASVWSWILYCAIVVLGLGIIFGFAAALVVPFMRAVVPFVALAFLGLVVVYLFLRPFVRKSPLEP